MNALSHILPDAAVHKLQRAGRRLARLQKSESKQQWIIGALANDVWDSLPTDIHEEVRKEDFYAEMSQWINHAAGRSVVSASGETLRRWADVERHYRQFPNLSAWKAEMSFHHFEQARAIGGNPLTNVTAIEALAFARTNGWTADEMRAQLDRRQDLLPEVIEVRTRWPLFGRFADILLALNGNRPQVEYHMGEIKRLVEADEKP